MVCTAKSVSTKDLADKDLNWLYITVEFLLKQFIYHDYLCRSDS